MTDLLEIFALGGLTLKRNNAPVAGLASRKAEALLVYLACTGQPHSREVLADLLWDDRSLAQGLANLRVLLTSLRQALEPFLTITRHEVVFNQESFYRLDVSQLEQGLAQARAERSRKGRLAEEELARLAQVITLYQGDFLQGFYLRDCQGFEEWQLAERERLHLRVIEGHYHLIEGYLLLEEYSTGITWARQMLQLDPLQEEGHRQLMRLLALSGQRPAALAQYELCRKVLVEELGVEPARETVALYEQVRAEELGGSRLAPTRPANGHPAAPDRILFQNLPTAANSFVNRVQEVGQIVGTLRDPTCRLLTLVGPGGIGKTRLAIEASRQIAANLAGAPAPEDQAAEPALADGIYFIALDSLSSAEFLASTLADALNFSFYGGTDPASQLISFLREKQMLLVLDNLEHLPEGVHLLGALLKQAPQVKILAVSRERLNLQEEYLLAVRGLELPAGDSAAAPSSAVELFLQRAQAIYPGFKPAAAERVEIERICHLLEGIPLAIELAATWVRLLSCREIAEEIDRSLDFLVTSLRNVPERHRSLRAVFDSSWQLLRPEERNLFRRLAVFRGGFQRQAAEQVVAASLPHLLALVDKSLIYRTEIGRYMRHVLLWQYAAEKLEDAPAEKARVQARHCHYYATFLREREAALRGGKRQQEVLAEIRADIENVRTSWYWAVEQGQTGAIEQAMDSLFHFYDMSSWFQEGAEVFGQAVTGLENRADKLLHGRLLARQGWFTFQVGQQEQAKARLRQGLALLREVSGTGQARRESGFALNYLGAIHQHTGEHALARQYLLESLAICQEEEDIFGLSIALNILSQVAYLQGDYSQARRLGQESLSLKQDIGDRRGIAFSFRNLGLVAYAAAEFPEAQSFLQESLTIYREMSDQRGVALCLNHLGDVCQATSAYQEAMELYEESLTIFREIGNQWGLIAAYTKLGHMACRQEEYRLGQEYLTRALKMALDIHDLPAALAVLVELAALRANSDKLRALEMLSLTLHHPIASKETRDRATHLLADLASRLPAETVAAALERGQKGTPEGILKEFAGPG